MCLRKHKKSPSQVEMMIENYHSVVTDQISTICHLIHYNTICSALYVSSYNYKYLLWCPQNNCSLLLLVKSIVHQAGLETLLCPFLVLNEERDECFTGIIALSFWYKELEIGGIMFLPPTLRPPFPQTCTICRCPCPPPFLL